MLRMDNPRYSRHRRSHISGGVLPASRTRRGTARGTAAAFNAWWSTKVRLPAGWPQAEGVPHGAADLRRTCPRDRLGERLGEPPEALAEGGCRWPPTRGAVLVE